LYRSGVFNELQYFKTFNERLQKHFDNFGRYNLSVADSSFDTWLDGYAPGIPNRKTNIYDEGNLLAFVTDMFIRKNSGNRHSLDDVMRYLYNEFALKNKGYSDADYKGIVEHFANVSYDDIFNNYINGISDYEPLLREAMNYIGCELAKYPAVKFQEHALGIKVQDVAGICRVIAVFPGSVADEAGISINDELLVINNIAVKPDGSGTNFTEWCNYFGDQQMNITVSSMGLVKQITVTPKPEAYYKTVQIQKNPQASDSQKQNYEQWSAAKF